MESVEVLNTFVKGDCGFDIVGIVAIEEVIEPFMKEHLSFKWR